MEEQFATVDIVENKIQFVLGLEGIVEVDDERMLDLLQDLKHRAKIRARVSYIWD